MNREPLVSVCIPTYRGELHIGAAIESVLTQTLADFELVIIDDKSPDATLRVVEELPDSRIRVLVNPSNLGPEGNWNRCLAEARGRYIKILPHDDVLNAACLERQVALLESDVNGEIALTCCRRNIIDASDRVVTSRGFPGLGSSRIPAETAIRRCIRRGTNLLGEPGAVLFRRSTAESVGAFDAQQPYVIDLDYWFRLLSLGDAYYLDDALAGFRVSSGSWSVAIGRAQSRDFLDFAMRVASQKEYGVQKMDLLVGNVSARANQFLRWAFYKYVVR